MVEACGQGWAVVAVIPRIVSLDGAQPSGGSTAFLGLTRLAVAG